MKKKVYKICLLCMLLYSYFSGVAQSTPRVIRRDHRNEPKNTSVTIKANTDKKVVTVPTSRSVTYMDRHPANLSQFKDTDLCFKDVVRLADIVNKPSTQSRAVLADMVQFNSGTYSPLPNPAGPTEILLLTDTLYIKGKTILDFSNNVQNRNGYLAIICRVLKLEDGATLQVKLSRDENNRYRQFSLLTEDLVLNNVKITFDQARILKERIVNGNMASAAEQVVVVNKPTLVNQVFLPSKSGMKMATMKIPGQLFRGTFMASIAGRLDESLASIPGSETFFYRWILSMHRKILNDLTKQDISLQPVMFAKKYLRLIRLQKYNVPPSGQLQAVQQQISKLRKDNLGNEACFGRKEYINNTEYNFVSFLSDQAVENVLPPDIILINAAGRGNDLSLGYFIFDKDNPTEMTLEFDISLSCQSRRQRNATAFLSSQNEQLTDAAGRFQFQDMYVTGPDLQNDRCKVIQLSDNRFKIKLNALANSSLIFHKLFGDKPSDIFLKGKWKATGSAALYGEFNIPVTLSKMDYLTVQVTNDSIRNPLAIPVGVDLDNFQTDASSGQIDQLIVGPRDAKAIPQKRTKDKSLLLPADAVSLAFDPNKYADYFEVIDESDRITQDIIITNNISSIPFDSLSGYLEYVDLQVLFEQPKRNGQEPLVISRNIQLSPSVSVGNNITIGIMKLGKDYVPVTIQGKAHFENGEYELKALRVPAGEMIVKITSDMLLSNQK